MKRRYVKRPKVKHTEDEVRDEITRLEELIFRKPIQHALPQDEEVVDKEQDVEDEKIEIGEPIQKKKIAAWEDEEDLLLTVEDVVSSATGQNGLRRTSSLPVSASTDQYGKLLQEKFKAVVGTPKWAKLKEKTEEDEFSSRILRNSSKLLGSSGTLASTILNFTALSDMNEPGIVQKTVIPAIDFNPTAQVSAVANRSGNVMFYQVDGDKNSLLHKVAFEKFPIAAAKFSADGSELLVGSVFKAGFQSLDLATNKATFIPAPLNGPEFNSSELFCLSDNGEHVALAGKGGSVAILTSHTKELIHTVKMPSKCIALNFSSDSSKLFTYAVDGKVYIWDVKQRKCLHRFVDDGCLKGTKMSLSAGDHYLALGSESGVVNVYDGNSFMPGGLEKTMYPQPLKVILNLTTPVTCAQFNPTAQILAISSRLKDSSLKLVHLPSMTVFKNFPLLSMGFGRVETIAFSPNSGYMAVGTNIGTAKLIRLNHYSNY